MSDPTRTERIDAAEAAFFEVFEENADEWSETFSLGCAFARRLCDTTDDALCEAVIAWLESAAAPAEGGAP